MALRVIGIVGQDLSGLQSQIDAAMQAATTAQATGANARNMVLTRDATLNTLTSGQATLATQQASLESLAATLGAAIPASEVTHAAQWAAINALIAKAATFKLKRVSSAATLALGATVDLAVTWDAPFPDANYVALPVLDAATGVVNITTPGIKSQTATGCVVSFKTNIALLAAVNINVIGLRFG
ncbi:hypothetical protein [Nocardioides aurantiacus]|uniref:Uncharacterized protein n=1 Tax=Nocardioides aurantiacus TaxID=86796 RepID=A0A3N2CWB4_9ACTN|nr:hypothetical protein [Nocardioides aurantiacus]ROR91756.1 hypothetical protein EDD33_2631 [Nocardioides aurantiacus]